jgi:cytochrome b
LNRTPTVATTARTRIWDLPTRLFHWLLVATLAGSWATHELGTAWMDWHVRLGYFALGLVIFRLCWGLVGPRHARFASFVVGPSALLRYLRSWLRRAPDAHAGHSPTGGWAVLFMLALVGLQATSGLFKTDDFLIQGPWYHAAPSWLTDLMGRIHHSNFELLLALVGLHLLAVLAYGLGPKPGMIRAMLSGDLQAPAAEGIAGDRLLAALATAAVAAGLVALIVMSAPQPDPGDLLF